MKLIKEHTHKEKKSRFIAHLYRISREEEIQPIIDQLKQDHRKAAHVCWAALAEGQELFRNDGEVGHPANTMLEVLKSKNKEGHLLAVVRYFGGVKLGPGGVKRAFKAAAQGCL